MSRATRPVKYLTWLRDAVFLHLIIFGFFPDVFEAWKIGMKLVGGAFSMLLGSTPATF